MIRVWRKLEKEANCTTYTLFRQDNIPKKSDKNKALYITEEKIKAEMSEKNYLIEAPETYSTARKVFFCFNQQWDNLVAIQSDQVSFQIFQVLSTDIVKGSKHLWQTVKHFLQIIIWVILMFHSYQANPPGDVKAMYFQFCWF